MAELKQKQKFEQYWSQFQTITGSKSPEEKIRIEKSEVPGIFQKVVLERNEKAQKDFEVKLLAILEAKVALDQSIKKGREELAKKEEIEYEKLNKALNDAFSMLKNTQQQGQNLMNQASGNFTATKEEEDTSSTTEEGEVKE